MASMEQLNDFEHASSRREWGIDKKIPIALIFVVVLQTLGFTWGAATLSGEVKNNGKAIVQLETKVEKLTSKLERSVNELHKKDVSLREFDKLEHQIGVVQTRLLDIERKVFK